MQFMCPGDIFSIDQTSFTFLSLRVPFFSSTLLSFLCTPNMEFFGNNRFGHCIAGRRNTPWDFPLVDSNHKNRN